MSIKFINNEKENSSERKYVFVDINQKETIIKTKIDDPDAELITAVNNRKNCCYSLKTEKDEFYFIKMSSSKVFNPAIDTINSKRDWKYKKVLKNKYENYLKFLSTKSNKYLRLVEMS